MYIFVEIQILINKKTNKILLNESTIKENEIENNETLILFEKEFEKVICGKNKKKIFKKKKFVKMMKVKYIVKNVNKLLVKIAMSLFIKRKKIMKIHLYQQFIIKFV